MRKYGSKVHFLMMKSQEAIDHIKEPLDFVYIDGNHIYEYVKADIMNYYQKLTKDGLLCGHDFSSSWLGVIASVTEFSVEKHLTLVVEKSDWWLLKK
jgi:hypothetical protein